ncbi:MAG: bifunctional 2-methylcitrate synthase/citrate synthase [Defluviicoccus sp.]|nr:bifunctional 2-methylcitrate synthase/citrate synthase [Defluviicoccus sp.]MDE0385497.1 bifunctional 2-methylcitrate synthase/citrate synthase [Defluviicoccus sp.]
MAEPQIQKGLAGVTVDTTAISKVVPETNSLTYRGYAVQELCAEASFEEVAWLLWRGELPTADELDRFKAEEAKRRELSDDHIEVIRRIPSNAHPMDALRTAVSYLGTMESAWGGEPELADRDRALDLLAKIPTMIATDFRFRTGALRIAPREDLSLVENFFNMCFNKVPPPEVIKAFDTSMILYAEHSFNASTFTVRTIASSLSDIFSAVTGGIGSLKGPLHGGANEAVMKMFLEIGDPEIAEEWMREAIARKRLVMGFGHRVYKSGDSRVPTMRRCLEDLAAWKGDDTWIRMSDGLQRVMIEEKGIYPNLDFPAGPSYYMMGFEIEMFTPIFVMSRITGWTAHYLEQNLDNRLIRPLSAYNGVAQRPVPPIGER